MHSQSAQQRILQEHVTRVASGEGSSARAVDLHQLQIRPPRGGRLAAGAPASSSPPESAVQPPSGPQARADRRREGPWSIDQKFFTAMLLSGMSLEEPGESGQSAAAEAVVETRKM